MTLEDYKKGCEQWDRNELLESLYNITNQNNKAIEYIKHAQNYGKEKNIYVNGDDLLTILKGEGKE